MMPFERQTPSIIFARFPPTSVSLRTGPLNFFEVGAVAPHCKFRAKLYTSLIMHGVLEADIEGFGLL